MIQQFINTDMMKKTHHSRDE